MGSKNKNLTVVSLFAGCGGLDLGFINAGFEVIYANDFDKNAAKTYKNNIGDIDTRDIRKIEMKDIPAADVLLAGFPCQPFSSAGNRKGVNDERGTLFLDTIKIIEQKSPKIVIFENVRGILSIKDNDGKLLIDRIISELSNAGTGYNVKHALVNASDFGVPQNRRRVFFVGVRKDMKTAFDFKKFASSKIEPEKLKLKFVLSSLPENDPNDEHWPLSPQGLLMAKHIPEGGSWKNVPDSVLPGRFKKIRLEMKKYHAPNFYRRFSRDEICGTVTAAATPENSGILHPHENRRYTIREVARIQSFPDNFVFHGSSIPSKYKQIGNAVPPKLAYHLAEALKRQFFN